MVTERDIAAVVTECLGLAIAERAQRIASAESELDAPAPPPPPAEQTLGGSSATTGGQRTRKSKRIWWGAAVASGLLLLVGSFALGGSGGHRDVPQAVASTPVAPPSAAPLQPPAVTTSASPITVTLRAYPARAALYLDDGPALPNPYQLTVLPDSNTHQVRAAAPGFSDHTEELRLDSSKEVRLTLSALAPGAAARVPNVKPKASAEVTHTGTPDAGVG